VRRANPSSKVIVTGCYAQRAPQDLASLDGVDAVVGNSHKSRVIDVALTVISPQTQQIQHFVSLGASSNPSEPISASTWHDSEFAHADLAILPFAADAGQTRPNLKIQDGCGNRCSFCIIPVTRGPSRSVSLPECLRAVEEFAESGGQELVLSGINLGRWGRDLLPVRRFEELVAAILDRTTLPRLRISSVEPMDWSADLIGLFKTHGRVTSCGVGPRLARHAHLPLQSGSDTILRAMHRRYRPWHYEAKVAEIHALLPEAAIGADVMIGFPGETEALFQETYDFIDKLPFTYLHVFPFSARPGTAAFAWHQATPCAGEAVNDRKERLRELIARKSEAFRRRLIGSELSVVTLAGGDSVRTEALSDNFVKTSLPVSYDPNQLLRIRATGLSSDGLTGQPISAS
jgi:threonylcarbamoyladenosine tRNA methylthiotransferase MtaB